MATQTRKPEASKHLDASLIPLRNALLWRVEQMQDRLEYGATHGVKQDSPQALIAAALIGEFRALAEELHHW